MDRLVKHSYVRQLRSVLARNRGKVITVVVALVLIRLNKALSRRARNNAVSDRYDWSKEIVVITGGSSGIGDCLVKRLSERGIKVAILDVVPPPETRARVQFFKCDITSKSELASAAQEIRSSLGHPTILINNAGVVRNAPILDKRETDIHFTLNVNTVSHFFTVQEFVPSMIKANHGHIITTSSLAAFLASPSVSDYNMSKAAATSFHESLGVELKHVQGARKIRTSIIHPSYVRTTLHAANAFGSEENPMLRDALVPDDVARKIEDVVLSGESRTVIVPPSLAFIAGMRGLSEWCFRGLLDTCAVAALK